MATKTVSVDQKIEYVEAILNRLFQDIDYAIKRHAFWCVANEDVDLGRVFNQTIEVKWMNIVQETLIDAVILALVRAHDKSTNDRACLPKLISLLKHDDVKEFLLERAKTWCSNDRAPEGEREMVLRDKSAEMHVETARKSIAKVFELYEWLTQSDIGKKWNDTIRDHRDRFLGHSLINEPEPEPARFEYISVFLEQTTLIHQQLELAVRGTDHRWEEFRQGYENYAREFWTTAKHGRSAR